ncbi:hypothetical protein [Streptomyces anulatus]|uniref:hypothetical protein n=1 Tax=Streptomyces anulatus TaxID=1892 RepID=UPI0034064E3F
MSMVDFRGRKVGGVDGIGDQFVQDLHEKAISGGCVNQPLAVHDTCSPASALLSLPVFAKGAVEICQDANV